MIKRAVATHRIDALEQLLDGRRPLGRLERLAYQRQIDDLKTGHRRGLVWREDVAARRIQLIRAIRLWKGRHAGQPVPLQPYQSEAIVAPLFGWYLDTGRRRFNAGHVEIPRKNGKTTLMALIALSALVGDGERGAQIYSLATREEQARIMLEDAQRCLAQTPGLRDLLESSKRSILYPRYLSSFRALAASGSLDGLDVHMALVDELQEHKTRAAYDRLITGTPARENPLVLSIGTAGFDRETIWHEVRSYADEVLAGQREDDRFFSYIAAADAEDSERWRDPAVWAKANPSLGVTLAEEKLAAIAKRCEGKPAAIASFKRLHLNLETETATRELEPEQWDACCVPRDQWPELRGRPAWVGVDLANTQDMTALVVVVPCGEHLYLVPDIWCPRRRMMERLEQGRGDYWTWHEQGYLHVCDGAKIDNRVVEQRIHELPAEYDVQEVLYDPWQAADLIKRCEDEGVKVIAVPQNYSGMSAATKWFLDAVVDGVLVHDGHKVLRWMALNLCCDRDTNDNLKPNKKKSGSQSGNKIDGVVAAIMGISRAKLGVKKFKSIYSEPGNLSL